jgi:hypothetical protein
MLNIRGTVPIIKYVLIVSLSINIQKHSKTHRLLKVAALIDHNIEINVGRPHKIHESVAQLNDSKKDGESRGFKENP